MKILCNEYSVKIKFGFATLYSRGTGNVAQKDIPSKLKNGFYIFRPKHIRGVFSCTDLNGKGAKWVSEPIGVIVCADWMN